MVRFLKLLALFVLACGILWFILAKFSFTTKVESNHQLLLQKIEAIGKLELVKYRISDVLEHTNKTPFLPDASILLIIKADAVGCIDLTKITPQSIASIGDSVTITLPQPEICYVKIDHNGSKVYDTKMAFFREANLVDEAYKAAENKINEEVKKSDIINQTKSNALNVLRPLLSGLGYQKVTLRFE